MDRFRASRTTQLLSLVFVCATLALSIDLLRRAFPLYLPHDWPNAHAGDALVDWKAAKLYVLGVSPYTRAGLDYTLMTPIGMGKPPTTMFWFLPMTEYSLALAGELFSLLIWALLPLHVFFSLKALNWRAPVAITALICAAVMSTSWLVYHFRAIQYSEPIAFLYVLAWLCLRRNKDLLAGLCLGAAATIKLFPGVMMLMLLLARRWRAFFAASAFYVAVAIMMTAVYGWESWPAFLEQQKPIARNWMGSVQNSSLSGLFIQLLHPACLGSGPLDTRATSAASFVGLLLVAAAVWCSRVHFRRALDTDARAIDVPYALFTLLSVFANPWVWEHYYVLTIQPMLVLATAFFTMFRASYREWSLHLASTARFATITAISVLAALGFGLVLCALDREIWILSQYRDYWHATGDPIAHFQFHFLQALNFAPWIVLSILGYIALPLSRRLGLTTNITS